MKVRKFVIALSTAAGEVSKVAGRGIRYAWFQGNFWRRRQGESGRSSSY